ncbi:uncharacterized protein PHACADRAFT_259292 [Phanerochaete carnosa HHB-10118-sp]|uniref:Uncharacterized protein n=1 Tax=Phanerochaete carnosa (strain HHB-10118-sp) TaxID=650164 RepID=K5W2H6_PHACS|nr:uncharacterized protein PHACADRAFT_259292 [Phanerochaete carnosa HHB-10118-sp]EKM53119.1 hypothetical protein PHACADRAFT_259292 [Phanerochaete carnosa HHB-10118-sp]
MAGLSKDLPPLPQASPDEDVSNRPGLFKRVTTKLRSPSQSWAHPSSPAHAQSPFEDIPEEPNQKHKRKFSLRMPSLPAPQTVVKPAATLENSWTSPEKREAALRACGLVPAQPKPLRDAHGYKLPLSEQEERLDRDWALLPPDGSRMTAEGESEAERIKEAWLKRNAEASAPSARPQSPPKTPPRTRQSPPPLPAGAAPPQRSASSPERKETMRPEFHRDPNVAKLMQAMQGYKPENYRPPPKRKPTMPNSAQRYESDSDSNTDSD